jgi:uncharacterized protein (TIGR02646 family)
MIRVHRGPKPSILVRNATRWKHAIGSAVTDEAREKAQGKYKHTQIKEALDRSFHGKCAYCESRINHVDYPHIEHFKPKSIPKYYKLAVEWDNLLLACGRCNGAENKGVKFPTKAENGPLINPAKESPSRHFRFEFDTMTKLANVLGASKRGETTWRILGLNRPDLVRQRSDFVKKLWVIAAHYHQENEAREIIDEAVNQQAEYSAFAREIWRFVRKRKVLQN